MTDPRSQLLAGSDEVVPSGGFDDKLALDRPLRVKLGMDPTAPSVTLGWAVVLRKLRQFQDLGHTAVLIVGDMTARIGDPSGKSDTRPRLDRDVVERYAADLLEQFWKILDRDKTEVRYNSEWLEGLDLEQMLRLTGSTTVARMLEREDFAKRYTENRPISLMEFLYPLLQGYDSVAVDADVELGGTDQKFNLLVGRDLQRHFGKEPQVALTMPLLVGTDGVAKMSQSLGNYVGITEEADEMFGKLARVPDELIGDYRLLTLDFFTDPSESQRVAAALAGGSADPWSEKRRLAREVVDLYHGDGEGAEAEARFDVVHKDRELPDAIAEVTLEEAWRSDNGLFWAARVVAAAGLAASNGEARRLIEQGGVRLDGEALADPGAEFERSALVGRVLQVGRRRFVRLV